ncbi:MAG: hypothetical protein ACLFPF_08710 [Halanaerobiales bacterium]
MKINNKQQLYKQLMEYLNNVQLKNSGTEAKQSSKAVSKDINNTDNNKTQINTEKGNIFTDRILMILEGLKPQDRTLLINSIIKNNLPLDSEKITALVSYLQRAPDNTDNESMIKAFILLIKNQLPVNKESLEGIAANFNHKQALTYELNDLQQDLSHYTDIKQNSETTTTKDNTILNILKQLILNPTGKRNELFIQLEDYTEKLSNVIQLLQEQADNKKQKLLQHVIGQQIINYQGKKLLLQLEIPLFLPQYNKSIPGYLKIKQEEKGKSDKANPPDKNYRIDFIISLEKRGIIKAETYLSNGRIKIYFTCNKEETIELINLRFDELKEGLEEIGMNVEKPIIEHTKLNTNDINNMISGDTVLDTRNNEDFIHIDIRI